MDSFGSNPFDIFDVYRLYCNAISGSYPHQSEGYRLDDESEQAIFSREILSQLLKLVESRFHPRISIFDELFKLMSRLDLIVEFSEFSRFYDFVFFICRENGQKSITVSMAVMAWRLVLAGRFRMLNQWCNFVEKNQRHNISEDTWRQVLAFSRCVHEDLEGYDPEGAWPVLIDDFVEHMYRIIGLNETPNSFCNCGDPDAQPLEDTLPGLKICPGLKRKSVDVFQREQHEYVDKFSSSNVAMKCKRRNIYYADKLVHSGGNPSGVGTEEDFMENVRQNCSPGCSLSPCAIEGCLAKGFAGLLSSRACLQFERDNSVSYT